METISVFYSSTEEPYISTYREIFNEELSTIATILDVKFHVIFWKENIPGGLSSSPQQRINEYVRGRYQIYFGLLGTKFGSGTEAEYRRAVEDHILNGSPSNVYFAFCRAPIDPYAVDQTFARVKRFKKDLSSAGNYKLANLYSDFENDNALRRSIRTNFKSAVEAVRGRVAGGMLFKP